MSLLVTKLSYQQAIRAIREVVLDTNPVQCFKVSGQDFSFLKDNSGFAIDGETYSFTQLEKYYDLVRKLQEKGVSIAFTPDYVALEQTRRTVNFNWPDLTTERTVKRENYFSDAVIESVIEDFYNAYMYYSNVPRTVEAIYGETDYFDRRKMVLWVAYYLIDRKRMNYATAGEIIRLQDEEAGTGAGCSDDGQFRNIDSTVTTRVGEVFVVTEKTDESGKGLAGFTDFWGDKYGYFTKLQLWIRDQFERQFKDFSLRDDCMISQTFTLEKNWLPFTWAASGEFSGTTQDILNPPR